MFEGKKQVLFWFGLIILALASIILFGNLWPIVFDASDIYWMFRNSFPIIVGAVVLYILKGYSYPEIELYCIVASELSSKDIAVPELPLNVIVEFLTTGFEFCIKSNPISLNVQLESNPPA